MFFFSLLCNANEIIGAKLSIILIIILISKSVLTGKAVPVQFDIMHPCLLFTTENLFSFILLTLFYILFDCATTLASKCSLM